MHSQKSQSNVQPAPKPEKNYLKKLGFSTKADVAKHESMTSYPTKDKSPFTEGKMNEMKHEYHKSLFKFEQKI